MKRPHAPVETRTRLLEAAVTLIRAQGYAATTVDDLCRTAGVTKGAFFHHFPSKEALVLAAAEHFSAVTTAGFAAAPYQTQADPAQQLLDYVDFRTALLQGDVAAFSCLFGALAQETAQTHPTLRDAADRGIRRHAADLEAIIERALQAGHLPVPGSAQSLALHIQAVLQGAFVLAKARQGPAVAVQSLAHLRRYLELLFIRPPASAVAPSTSAHR